MISLQRKKGDYFVVIAAVALIIAMVIAMFSYADQTDNVVTVKYDGQIVHKMNLSIEETYTMKQSDYPLLQGDLTIVIENGKVRVDEQTSRYNYCELQGETSRKGTAIICAPNHVTITIDGYEDTGYDWPIGG